ncbi:hypothetical protein NOVO_00125 [Rickettsiales bacterium Ac37b]|nr:hypothetical protein NOVO_00125 [Rickettsiales bacterium Ac37b]
MATFVGTQVNFYDALKEMLELEYDAIEAYKAAIERLKDKECKDTFKKFLGDHERHKDFLTKALEKVDGLKVPKGGDMKEILTKGKVLISSLLGDKSILSAMKTNEDDTNSAYERLNNYKNIPITLKSELANFFKDEQKHRAWIEEKVDKLEKNS